jgi:hypothetical protein
MKEISKSIYKTLIYQSLFKRSPRVIDLYSFLITDKFYDKKSIEVELKSLKNVSIKDDYVCLKYNNYVSKSKERFVYSQEKLEIAKKVSKILSKIPWFKMIAVSGAVAASNATENDDIDLFVITSSHRIWLARFADWLILNFIKVRRNADSNYLNNKICINYYLAEDALELKNKDVFTANEIAHLIPLYGFPTYEKFISSNSWIKIYLGKFWDDFNRNKKETNKNETFRFVLFDLLEELLGKFQFFHMRKKITKEKISNKELRFHPNDVRLRIISQFEREVSTFFKNYS